MNECASDEKYFFIIRWDLITDLKQIWGQFIIEMMFYWEEHVQMINTAGSR